MIQSLASELPTPSDRRILFPALLDPIGSLGETPRPEADDDALLFFLSPFLAVAMLGI